MNYKIEQTWKRRKAGRRLGGSADDRNVELPASAPTSIKEKRSGATCVSKELGECNKFLPEKEREIFCTKRRKLSKTENDGKQLKKPMIYEKIKF